MTLFAFQEIFFRLQQGLATREEIDLFLDALQTDAGLERYFQQLLKAHFDQRPASDGPISAAGSRSQHTYNSTALDQLLTRSWEQIDLKTKTDSNASDSDIPLDRNNTATGSIHDASSLDASGPSSATPFDSADRKRSWLLVSKWAAAAAIVFVLGLSAILYRQLLQRKVAIVRQAPPATHAEASAAAGRILPGTAAAVLTLANGQQILLDSTPGQNITSGDQLVAYNKGGKIDYQKDASDTVPVQYSTLTTEKGNRYQLILPDGTHAWLNALSSIRFPDRFSGSERTVVITGEVYFDVHHDPARPFIVQVKGQTIRDLGTAFNINAYDDEPAIKATLIEGIIEVNDTRLQPGWQAAIKSGGKMTIDKNADLSAITSWKNNNFVFHQTDMPSILRQIARWYDVQIIYKGSTSETFTGGISREASLSDILKILSFSNKIKFDVHDRNIIVHPQ